MDITRLMDERIPESIKTNIIDFVDGKLEGKDVTRVLVDKLFNADEEEALSKLKFVIYNSNMVCHYRFAPEIKKSYFYIVR